MEEPLVYIVIINWNGLSDTLECLKSLAALSYKAVRTIVVDNGSEAKQANVIEKEFPNVTVLRQMENLGFCGGCNVGIRYAMDNGANFVLLLNNDTLVMEDLLERLLKVYKKTENVGAVSPVVLEYPDTARISYARPKWSSEIVGFVLKEEDETLEELSKKEPYKVQFAIGCCMLVPAEVYRTAGLLDERYFAYYDEIEWCYRIRRFGYESYVAPKALIYHKLTRSTPVSVRSYLMSRNRLLWIKENLDRRQRFVLYIGFLKQYLWHILNAWGLFRLASPESAAGHLYAAVGIFYLAGFINGMKRPRKRFLE